MLRIFTYGRVLSTSTRLFAEASWQVTRHDRSLMLKCSKVVSPTRFCVVTKRTYTSASKQVLPIQRAFRHFSTSKRREAAPLIGALLLKLMSPISRVVAMLAGRQFRRWWSKLSEAEKREYLAVFLGKRWKILAVATTGAAIPVVFYLTHIEKEPITGRRRFIALSNENLLEISTNEYNMLLEAFGPSIIPCEDTNHMRVARVARRIIEANYSTEVQSLDWEVNVVDDDTINAFVLPQGQIFVMKGMLATVANDDELAGILGHEMAHAILRHQAEQLSFSGLFSLFSLFLVASLWAIVPVDMLALLTDGVQSKIQDILLHLPYARKLEVEADRIGTLLAAKACYDVRHMPKFWERMRDSANENDEEPIEWLSTHPNNSDRVTWLNDLLPEAIELRKSAACPDLRQMLKSSKKLTK